MYPGSWPIVPGLSGYQKAHSIVDFSFPRHTRLLDATDFKAVFDNPSLRISSKYFLLLALRTTRPCSRLGLVVSKKNTPKAVHRNRIKRIIRESFRIRRQEFDTIDLVVLARHGLSGLQNHDLHRELDRLITQLEIKLTGTDD